MSDKPVTIGIKTTADTTGATKALAALGGLSAEEARYAAAMGGLLTAAEREVAEVERMVAASQKLTAARDAEIKASKDADMAEAARCVAAKAALDGLHAATTNTGTGAKNLSGFFTQAGYQITDFSVQVQMGTSAITAFSQQFPQLMMAAQQSGLQMQGLGKSILSMSLDAGTAISGIAVAAGIGFTMLSAEYDKMKAAQKGAADAATRHKKVLEDLGRARQLVLNQQREEAIARIYAQQAADLERQADALKRIQDVRAAEGALAGAQAGAAVTMATNAGGGGVADAKTNAMVVDMANQLQALQDKLDTASLAATTATEDAQAAKTVMIEAGRTYGEFSDKYKELDAAWQKAETAATKANLDLAAEKEKFPLAQAAIAATFGASLDSLKTETQASITKEAQALQAEIAAMTPAAFSQAGQGLTELGKILKDGEIQGAAEMAMLRDAMIRIKQSQEGRDSEVMKTLSGLEILNTTVTKSLGPMNDRIRALERFAQSLATSR